MLNDHKHALRMHGLKMVNMVVMQYLMQHAYILYKLFISHSHSSSHSGVLISHWSPLISHSALEWGEFS